MNASRNRVSSKAMKRQAYAKRRDANEPEIVAALKKVGATIQRVDFCDLVVGFRGVNYLVEVKMPGAPLKPTQTKLIEQWGGQYGIARNPTEALLIIGAMTS